jgi:hypothetical protein
MKTTMLIHTSRVPVDATIPDVKGNVSAPRQSRWARWLSALAEYHGFGRGHLIMLRGSVSHALLCIGSDFALLC